METKSANKLSSNPLETSPEVRAYVYQRLQEFEPYLLPNTQTGVVIEQIVSENEAGAGTVNEFRVHLSLNTEGGKLVAQGQAKDVYAAIAESTRQLMAQISMIHNAVVSSRERDLEIQQMYKHPYLH